MNSYNPKPINTNTVDLPADLIGLTEIIAENVHEVWAAGRIAEGWKYGDVRDPAAKTTPMLVPYSQLPESEKDYDRSTAMETIKLMVKLGYKITK